MDIASRGQIAPPRQAIGFGVIGLLALGMFINYVDRGNLATAAPLIKDQLGLTNTQTGILLSAFFWTYTPFQLVAGWLAERINPYRTLAIGVGLWSLATIATGFAEGFTALLVLRLVLGMGESATFPCNAKLLARELPAERLGSANGTIGIGQALGPAVGTFAGGMLMAHFGWRPVFVLFGLVSALWLLPWLVATREASARAVTDASAPPPAFLNILGRRECWGASLGHFAHNYSLYFVISWLPLYLVKARGSCARGREQHARAQELHRRRAYRHRRVHAGLRGCRADDRGRGLAGLGPVLRHEQRDDLSDRADAGRAVRGRQVDGGAELHRQHRRHRRADRDRLRRRQDRRVQPRLRHRGGRQPGRDRGVGPDHPPGRADRLGLEKKRPGGFPPGRSCSDPGKDQAE